MNRGAVPTSAAGTSQRLGSFQVRTVLFRTLYRGIVTWNRTKKRNAFGQVQQRPRDPREWLQVDVPEWRIVSEDLWQAAHARLDRARQNYLAGTQGQPWGRPVSGTAAKYLLTGIARCGTCGAGLTVRSRAHGGRRSFRYVCATHHYRGRAICSNGLELHQAVADDAVLELLEADILRPAVVDQAIALALETLCGDQAGENRRTVLERQLGQTVRKLQQLTAAVEAGGHLPALIAAIAQRENERAALQAEIDALGDVMLPARRNRKTLERALRGRLADWRGLLRAQIAEARQVLEMLLEERLYSLLSATTPASRITGCARRLRLVECSRGSCVHRVWRPRRDSNPCFSLERAASWASGRRGPLVCTARRARNLRIVADVRRGGKAHGREGVARHGAGDRRNTIERAGKEWHQPSAVTASPAATRETPAPMTRPRRVCSSGRPPA